MEINNLDYIASSKTSIGYVRGGLTYTQAYTDADSKTAIADAAAIAIGEQTVAATVTHSLVQKSQQSVNSYGSAVAYAYGSAAKRIEDSYAISASRYHSTSFSGHITATSSFLSYRF